MNYRHVYHAGNFADVLKHAVLTRIVEYLKRKDKAFRVIDTHAGRGLYDLSSEEAQKTGEWRAGVGRLLDAAPPPDIASLLKPLLDSIRAENPTVVLTRYPGSPQIVRHLLRKRDRLTAIELQPAAVGALKRLFAGDIQTRVIELDGWLALGAQVPPKEKRGLMLIDPPFEAEGEFDRMVSGLTKAYRRWPGGIYAFWYPIKNRKAVEAFRTALAETGIPRIMDLTLEIRAPSPEPRLDGCGMAIVNPPYVLEEELKVLLPYLAHLLQEGAEGTSAIVWLRDEAVAT